MPNMAFAVVFCDNRPRSVPESIMEGAPRTKESDRIQLAETLGITPSRALVIFYETETGKMLHDPSLGLQLMSDTYIVNDIIAELRS